VPNKEQIEAIIEVIRNDANSAGFLLAPSKGEGYEDDEPQQCVIGGLLTAAGATVLAGETNPTDDQLALLHEVYGLTERNVYSLMGRNDACDDIYPGGTRTRDETIAYRRLALRALVRDWAVYDPQSPLALDGPVYVSAEDRFPDAEIDKNVDG
jgi:hypothetical protein